jgi:hypothetical protein
VNEATERQRVRSLSNRILMAISGKRRRFYSVVRHVGRRSGREYHKPVSAIPSELAGDLAGGCLAAVAVGCRRGKGERRADGKPRVTPGLTAGIE